MKRIRLFLVTFALIVTLGVLSVQGIGVRAVANATAHVSSVHAVAVVHRPNGPCPYGGENDC